MLESGSRSTPLESTESAASSCIGQALGRGPRRSTTTPPSISESLPDAYWRMDHQPMESAVGFAPGRARNNSPGDTSPHRTGSPTRRTIAARWPPPSRRGSPRRTLRLNPVGQHTDGRDRRPWRSPTGWRTRFGEDARTRPRPRSVAVSRRRRVDSAAPHSRSAPRSQDQTVDADFDSPTTCRRRGRRSSRRPLALQLSVDGCAADRPAAPPTQVVVDCPISTIGRAWTRRPNLIDRSGICSGRSRSSPLVSRWPKPGPSRPRSGRLCSRSGSQPPG